MAVVDSTDFKTLSIEPPTFHRRESETEDFSPSTSLGLGPHLPVSLSQISWTRGGVGGWNRQSRSSPM